MIAAVIVGALIGAAVAIRENQKPIPEWHWPYAEGTIT